MLFCQNYHHVNKTLEIAFFAFPPLLYIFGISKTWFIQIGCLNHAFLCAFSFFPHASRNFFQFFNVIFFKLDYFWQYYSTFPGWSPRANQRWTALFQRFQKFQRWSALFQNGLRKPALISAVSELFSAGFLWISAVQRWIKTNWETNENASCKFEKVLGSRKICSFGVYQLWKKSSGEILVKNSNWHTHLSLMLLGRTCPVE